VSRLPLSLVLASLPERPSPQRLEAARRADLQAAWFEREAAEARAGGRTGTAAAFAERAQTCRSEALRALGLA
jgi:hypothetical protein